MLKKAKNTGNEDETVLKNWKEGDLILTFELNRIKEPQPILMRDWLDVDIPLLEDYEQKRFDKTWEKGFNHIEGWSEEDLKMKFIAHVLDLGGVMEDENGIVSFFDKTISAEVEGIKMVVKSDFMIATGVLDVYRKPFFHFQEYKPSKNPSGDSMAQLLQAFLIAQAKNKDNKPLYGVEVVGKNWTFVTMEGKDYCVSNSFDCTDRDDLLKIIAVLRKFKEILFSKLMKD